MLSFQCQIKKTIINNLTRLCNNRSFASRSKPVFNLDNRTNENYYANITPPVPSAKVNAFLEKLLDLNFYEIQLFHELLQVRHIIQNESNESNMYIQ